MPGLSIQNWLFHFLLFRDAVDSNKMLLEKALQGGSCRLYGRNICHEKW